MPLRVTLTDYGVGNLYSIRRSLENCGAKVDVIRDMSELKDAECIVFPGVGAFDKTMEKLLPHRDEVRDMLMSGTPALGICIGMQILYEGTTIPTFFRKANAYGTQFHPEKSSDSGMTVLRNFIRFAESVL